MAAEADEDLRRRLPDADLDDSGWAELPVPGQWQSSAAFAQSDGPLLYRHRFDAVRPDEGQRWWLTFDGIFYQADVWLDGSYLGDTEGYFFPHTFEVGDQLRAADEHLLAVEVSCSPQRDRKRKRNLTGVFQHWDSIDPAFNPGGIWAPVRLAPTGPVRIGALRALCFEANQERAVLQLTATLDSDRRVVARVETTVTAAGGDLAATSDQHHALAAGANLVSWRVIMERPSLWWPRALGDQPLYDVAVNVSTPAGPSDKRRLTTGLRQVRMRRFVASVNGEQLFLKGANLGPTRRALADVTPADVAADLDLAAEAGLDLLRVHAHIGHPELYRQADRAGMLIWQDLPLQWSYSHVRREAVRQAGHAVDLLGHHPSVVVWCGHDEPAAVDPPERGGTGLARSLVAQLTTGWSGPGLDRSVRRALERADGSRPVVAHSGVLPLPAGGSDTHLSLGWDAGDERELPELLASWPVLARFVGSFGTPAAPLGAEFLDPTRWPDLDWDALGSALGVNRAKFDRRIPPADYKTPDAWALATQAYQATVARYHVESLRRLKYRPTGGFCYALLADCQPAVSRALLDDRRRPKEAFAALRAACAPVVVVADRPAATYPPGAGLDLAVHVVSDLRVPLGEVTATATLTWPGGRRAWGWRGDVPADDCVLVGRVVADLPADAEPGPLQVDLALSWRKRPGGEVATVTNRYASEVAGGRSRPRSPRQKAPDTDKT